MELSAMIVLVKHWIINNLGMLILLPGNLLMADALVRSAAEAHGYKSTVAILDKVANFLSFVADIIGGALSKKQVPVASSQKVD